MSVDARATGWKIPLLFCAVIALIVGGIAYMRSDNTVIPPLPAPLYAEAQKIVIDLNLSPEGRTWKELISGTAGGFFTRADKDIKIAALVLSATEQKHYDAACTAAVLMYNDFKRDEVLLAIAQSTMNNCASLPWGVLAAKGMKDKKNTAQTHLRLTEEWQRCQKNAAAQ